MVKDTEPASIYLQDAGFLWICSALEKYILEKDICLGMRAGMCPGELLRGPHLLSPWDLSHRLRVDRGKGNWLSSRTTVWLQRQAETSHKLTKDNKRELLFSFPFSEPLHSMFTLSNICSCPSAILLLLSCFASKSVRMHWVKPF